MTTAVHHRLAATALAAGLILTACGQKPGVHVEGTGQVMAGSQPTAQGGSAGSGSTTAGAGSSTASTGGGSATTGSTGSGASTGGGGGTSTGAATGTAGGGDSAAGGDAAGRSQSGGQEQAPADGGGEQAPADDGGGEQAPADGGDEEQTPAGDGGGEQAPAQGQYEVTGSDRTGVSDDAITVAFHAPVTGAAPLPQESFRDARDLYWKAAQAEGRTFVGRETVNVLFQDDKYDPSNAQQVCRQLASEAFLVGGGGGTDQIQACGQLAGARSFPYVSAGVTEAGLADNPWYFASSMTYRQQGILLGQYIAKNFPDKKIAAIVTQTGNFDDAAQGFEQGIQEAGLGDNFVETLRHPKGDTSWYNSYAQQLDDAGVEVVYVNTSPVDYIQFAQQAKQSGYGPQDGGGFQYVGVGVTMGLNAVLQSGCGNNEVHGGIFFSPFPGLDWAKDNVPEFFEASAEFGTAPDDLAFALWAMNKQLDVLFQRYEESFGTDLTREDFRALVESGGPIETGIFPNVAFSPDNHFGGQGVHVLQADCGSKEHKTLATFQTGF